MSCWRSFGAAEFLDSCLHGLIVLVAFSAGGCLFWTDVVDTLPRSGLVGWCLESVFFADEHTIILSRTRCQFGNRPRGDSEKPRRSTKRNIGPCKA